MNMLAYGLHKQDGLVSFSHSCRPCSHRKTDWSVGGCMTERLARKEDRDM